MSERMKGNDWLNQIRNHQVQAPADIMERAIQKANKKRFFAFHWTSMNVWYWGVIMLSLAGWGIYSSGNSKEEMNPISSSSGIQAPINKVESNIILPASTPHKGDNLVIEGSAKVELTPTKRKSEMNQDRPIRPADINMVLPTPIEQTVVVSSQAKLAVPMLEEKMSSADTPPLEVKVETIPEIKPEAIKPPSGKSKKLAVKVFGKP